MARGMYWTCEFGSNHDHGERCDCQDDQMVNNNSAARKYAAPAAVSAGARGRVGDIPAGFVSGGAAGRRQA